MNRRTAVALAFLAVIGCGKPVPPRSPDFAVHSVYGGTWVQRWELKVGPDGAVIDESIRYARERLEALRVLAKTGIYQAGVQKGRPIKPLDLKRIRADVPYYEKELAEREKQVPARLTASQLDTLHAAAERADFFSLPRTIKANDWEVFDVPWINIQVTSGGRTQEVSVLLWEKTRYLPETKRLFKVWCAIARAVPPPDKNTRPDYCP